MCFIKNHEFTQTPYQHEYKIKNKRQWIHRQEEKSKNEQLDAVQTHASIL